MISAEKLLKELNGFADVYYGLGAEPKFQSLVQSLKEEIALSEQKKAGKADRFKGALRFSKATNKQWKNARPGIAGAYIGESGKQYITDTYGVVRYDKPYEGLVEAEGGSYPNLDKVIDHYNSKCKADLPSIAELKTELKTNKATGNLDARGISLTKVNKAHYNTAFLIQLIEAVEPIEAYFSNDSEVPTLVLIGDGAQGALLPVRPIN